MDGQLMKPNDHSDDQMEMMMMTAMMQMSKLPNDDDDFSANDVVLAGNDYQNPNPNNQHHGHHYHFMNGHGLPSAVAVQSPPPGSMMHSPPGLLSGRRSSSSSSMAAMREMIFRIAVMQPVHIDPESVKAPKRRNVRISKDPQSVAARHRRERISERIRILQRLVPGGTKMDTASMLDEAIHYVKFLKTQVQSLERASTSNSSSSPSSSSSSSSHHHHHHHHGIGFPVAMSTGSDYLKGHYGQTAQTSVVHRFGDHMLD